MSRRRNAGSAVRGPNSALTDFLREHGINHADIVRRNEQARAAAAAVEAEAETESAELAGTRSSTNDAVAGPSTVPVQTKKRAKKRKKGEDDDDNWNPYKKAAPVPGQIDFCAECDSRFTVTAYSRASVDGLLCSACGKKDAKQDKVQKKKRTQTKRVKRETLRQALDGEAIGPKTLREYCIRLVAKYIDDIEALGDIGTINMDRICQIISRNRSLNNTTIKLFMDPGSERLTLHDCAKIGANEMRNIATFVHTLKHLHLNNCGKMNDEVIQYYAEKLPALESFHISGAFLVSREAYAHFFSTVSQRLTSLTLSSTARTNQDVFTSIVKNCPQLVELRLSHLARFDDDALRQLSALDNLEVLDVSYAGEELTDDAVVEVLNSIGSNLKELNLSGNIALSTPTANAIHACCTRLQTLGLSECDLFTNDDILAIFKNWSKNRGLVSLSLSRVVELESSGLLAAAQHSGHSLEVLDINSCPMIDKEGLMEALNHCNRLGKVDVGFIRDVDDDVVEKIQSSGARSFSVWGCTRVTEVLKVGTDRVMVGREADLG